MNTKAEILFIPLISTNLLSAKLKKFYEILHYCLTKMKKIFGLLTAIAAPVVVIFFHRWIQKALVHKVIDN